MKLTDLRFYRYGPCTLPSVTWDDLIALAKEGEITARAENSGCEGVYVEVARWAGLGWTRFCHYKFFEGDDLKADHVAAVIEMSRPDRANLIHHLLDYADPVPPQVYHRESENGDTE